MNFLFASHHVTRRYTGTRHRLAAVGSVAMVLALVSPPPVTTMAEAAFPGRNGLIVFEVVRPAAAGLPGLDNTDLFIVPPGGTGARQITQGPESDTYPAWSPDGTRLAFTRSATYQAAGDIFVMEADSTGVPVNLTQSPQHNDWAPAWSPDGTRIVFSSARNAPTREPSTEDLYVMDADGGNLLELTSDGGAEYMPAWSPDGAWIAFRDDDGLRLISRTGSGRRLLVSSADVDGDAYAPDWSPDGKRILFSSTSSTAGDKIWVVNADGTGLRNFPAPANSYGGTAWSPDGRKIVFERKKGTPPIFRLYTMNADGSHVRRLLDLDLNGPAWPDWGRRP